MKRKSLLLTLVIILIACSAFSQSSRDSVIVFCQVTASPVAKMGKPITYNVFIDYGQSRKLNDDIRPKDDSGNPIVFDSLIDALNMLSEEGWVYLGSYSQPAGNVIVPYHLMSKKVGKEEKP